jgi:hypothetical protein
MAVDLTIKIDTDLDKKIAEVEGKIKSFQQEVKAQADLIKSHFTNGWEGLDTIVLKINTLKDAFAGISTPTNFVNALKEINASTASGGEGIEKLAQVLATLQQSLQQNIVAGANQAANSLDTTAAAANNTAAAISNVVQQAAQLSQKNQPILGTSSLALGANDANNAVVNGQIAQTIAQLDEWKKQIADLRVKYAQLKAEEVQSMGNAQAIARKNVASTAEEIAALQKKIEYIELSAEKQAKAAAKNNQLTSLIKDTTPLQVQLDRINSEMASLTERTERWRNIAAAARGEFAGIKMSMNFNAATEEIDGLLVKLTALKNKFSQVQGTKEKDRLLEQIKPLQARYDELSVAVDRFVSAENKAYHATNLATNAISGYDARLEGLRAQYVSIITQMNRMVDANTRINSAISKGYNLDSITREYANLAQQADRFYAQMETYRAKYGAAPAVGDTSSIAQAYREIESQYYQVQARMNEIAQINSDIRTQYDTQKNIEAFQREMAEYQKLQQQKKDAQQKVVSANDALTNAASAKSYNDRSKAIKDCNDALQRIDETESSNKTMANSLRKAIQDLTKAQEEYKTALKGKVAPDFDSAKTNATIALQKRNLDDLKRAYKDLETVMGGMKFGSERWNELNDLMKKTRSAIDEIKSKMGEMNKQQSQVMDISGQLQRQLAMVFSVSAISGYIEKLVQVRAQFELQRIALGAIIQSVDKANDIFKQVQNMALESPFSIMQLEKATKQIAAFGVEADKLQPSIKMLADISAGLGVDIDRLILVYGHIKANNALQQLHVRQFTNAGFNIAQNLADYYTEMEGKLVSVADVTDRIHKKMVSFADVEAVLKRVTSAGGMFYDMQKKQSDSLWGQMQRIKDQMDLMLNEVGQSNQSTISAALTTVRSLIKQWREFASVIKGIVYILSAWAIKKFFLGGLAAIGTKLIATFTTLRHNIALLNIALKNGATLSQIFGASMKSAMVSTGIGTLVVALGVLVGWLMKADGAAEQLKEELSRIGASQKEEMSKKTSGYLELVNKIKDTTIAYSEREQALQDLSRIYGDILPQYMLEGEYIENNTNGYKEATKAIQNFYAAQEFNKKLEAIMNSDEYQEAADQLKEVGERMISEGMFSKAVTKESVNAFVSQLTKELASGKIENTAESIGKRFSDYFGKNVDLSRLPQYFDQSLGKADFADVTDKIQKLIDAKGNLTLETLAGTKAEETYNNVLKGAPMDYLKNQSQKAELELEKLKTRLESLKIQYASTPNEAAQNAIQQTKEQIAELEQIISNDYGKAIAERTAEDIKTEFEATYQPMEDTIKKYADLKTKKENLERTSSGTKEERERIEELSVEMEKAKKSAEDLAAKNKFTLAPALFDTADNAFELQKNLNETKKISFKTFAVNAVNHLASVSKGILDMIGDVNWLKSSLNSLYKALTGADLFSDVITKSTKANDKNTNEIEAQNKALDEQQSLYKTAAKKYGVSEAALSKYKDKDAKAMRDQANEFESTYNYYQKLDDAQKKYFLSKHQTTENEIIENNKLVKSMNYIADAMDVNEKSLKSHNKKSSGKDEILETWKNRVKYIEDFYKQYSNIKKDFSTTNELTTQMLDSFTELFHLKGADKNSLESIGFNISNLLGGDMGSKGLKSAFEQLKAQIPAKYKDLIDEVQKKISDTSVTIGVETEKTDLEDFTKAVDELFDNYELSKTFKELGLNIDLTYMVGGKPTTLDDVRTKLEDLKAEFIGANGEINVDFNAYKKYKEYLKKITDMEQKELQTRIKNYSKYLTNTYGEQAKYMLDMYSEINKLRDDFNQSQAKDPANAATYARQAADAIANMHEEMKKKMAEYDFKSLMESTLFTDVFQDLSVLSNQAIDMMIDKLDEVRSRTKDLSLSQVRQLSQYYEKLQTAKINNSTFKEPLKAIKEAYKLTKKGWSSKKASNYLAVSEAELDRLKKLKEDILFVQGRKDGSIKIDQNDLQLTEQQSNLYNQSAEQLKGMLDFTNQQIDSQSEVVEGANHMVKVYSNAQTAIEKLSNDLKKAGETAVAGIDATVAGLEMLSVNISDADQVWIDWIENSIEGCINLAAEMVALGVKVNTTAGILGIIATALTVVGGLFKSILNSHDNRKQEEIEQLQGKVEDLQRAYDKLSDSIDKAFAIDQYQYGYDQMIANAENQINYYQEMIDLESEKKKADSDKIKEYKQAIEDLQDDLAELKEQRITDLGGFGESNYRSVAEDFVSAWLDAYKETGDGLDDLNDKWQEYMENLFLKQAAMKKAGTLYQKAMEIIDNAIDSGKSGFELENAIEMAKSAASGASEELNEYLKALAAVFGIGQEGESNLSDLQQGISNITEAQAAAIEAYLNSIRFYVASQDAKLSDLITAIREQYSSASNPLLSVVKEIRDALNSFAGQFSKAFVKSGSSYRLQVV